MNIKRNHFLRKISTETLLDVSKKDPFSIVAEKFLLLYDQQRKEVVSALEKEIARKKLYGISLGIVVFTLFVTPFLSPYLGFLLNLIRIEWVCRFVTGLLFIPPPILIGWLFFKKRRVWILGIISAIIGATLKEKHHALLYLSGWATFIWVTLSTTTILIYINYATLYIIHRWFRISALNRLFTSTSRLEGEVKMALNKALALSEQVEKKNLEALMREYAPQYASIFKKLTIKDVVLPEIPAAKEPRPTAPKDMCVPIPLGVNDTGLYELFDLTEAPHVLLGGATGKGKSNLFNLIIRNILNNDLADLLLIDPEQLEFSEYDGLPNVRFVGTLPSSNAALDDILTDVLKRQDLFKKLGVKNFKEVNENSLKRLVVCVDEYAQFYSDKSFQQKVRRIAQVGRKYGIHLVIGTQHPDRKVLDAQIQANLPVRIILGTATKQDAQTLGAPGAELLSKPGLAYFIHGQKKELLQIDLAPSLSLGQVSIAKKNPKKEVFKKNIQLSSSVQNHHLNNLSEDLSAVHQVDKLGQGSVQGQQMDSTTAQVSIVKKRTPGARFVLRKELIELVGTKRAQMYESTRDYYNGARRRGYWIVS